jgi:hypothetical protein
LLLVKNGSSLDCSFAGVTFSRFEPFVVNAETELGFDFLNGSHCGLFAPELDIAWEKGSQSGGSSLGCSEGTFQGAPQDPDHWTRMRANVLLKSAPPIPDGATITGLTISSSWAPISSILNPSRAAEGGW